MLSIEYPLRGSSPSNRADYRQRAALAATEKIASLYVHAREFVAKEFVKQLEYGLRSKLV